MSQHAIAMVITSMAGGGAEKVVLLLARTLRSLGHVCHIFVLRDHFRYADAVGEPDLHVVPGWSGPGVTRVRRLATSLAQTVHHVETEIGRPFGLIASHLIDAAEVVNRSRLAPVVHVVHASVRGELETARRRGPIRSRRERRRWACLDGHRLASVSPSLTRELETSDLIRPRSVTTVLNPIDAPAIRRLTCEPDPDIPHTPFLLHVGRAARQKRHDVLFEALKQVRHDLPLVCLAHNTTKIHRLARRHGVADRVITPGFRQNPYPWINRAELVVLSSDYEGLSLVLIEALVAGTPAVATDCPTGPSDILRGDLRRGLVPVRRPDLLATAIDRLLADPPDSASATILDDTRPEVVARRYLDLVESAPP